jgi:hypothetical protein
MNDDELNMMLARNDDEIIKFRDMDIKRERDALEAWRASGHRGRPPAPLLQFDELPECYQSDAPFEVKEIDEAMEGRGQRRRNVVSYTDGLSDDAWAMVCLYYFSADAFSSLPRRLWKKERICKSSPNVHVKRALGGSTTSCLARRIRRAVARLHLTSRRAVERARKGKAR